MTVSALDYDTSNCQVARTMAVLGERATVEVLREVFNGVRRFDDMQRHSGVARQVLSNRLAMLVEEGILHKVAYRPDGGRERHEYRPTTKGFDLYPVLCALADWGARYAAGPEGPAVALAHRGHEGSGACGAPVHAVLECEAGHRVEDPRAVVPVPGAGARRLPARTG
jgi:DNA-binding HxlR family transcriptional regulator